MTLLPVSGPRQGGIWPSPWPQWGHSIVGIRIVEDTIWRFARGDFTLIAWLKWRHLGANTQPSDLGPRNTLGEVAPTMIRFDLDPCQIARWAECSSVTRAGVSLRIHGDEQMPTQSSIHFYVNWAKERLDEMDATLTSLGGKVGGMQANVRDTADKFLTDLRKAA
jgi:hypothetical protein